MAVLVIGAGSFMGGMKYGQAKGGMRNVQAFGQMRGGQMGDAMNRRAGGLVGGMLNGVNGEVLSKDASSLTVKLRDGGSKQVLFSSSTQVSMMASGTIMDVNTGSNVFVSGKTNQDGSVTAETIQLRPAMVLPPMEGVQPPARP